jgi:hypothetical protein
MRNFLAVAPMVKLTATCYHSACMYAHRFRVLAKLLLEHTVTPYRLSVPLLKHLLNMRKFCKNFHSYYSTLMLV